MPPVDVPAIRSNSSNARFPDRCSISASTSAGISPRMPPPSMLSTRTGRDATTPGVRAVRTLAALCCAAVVIAAVEPPAGSPPKRAQVDAQPLHHAVQARPALPRHRDAPPLRDLPRQADQAGPRAAARRQRDRVDRPRPGRAARRALQPRLHARAPAHLQAQARLGHGADGRAAAPQVRPPGPLLVEVLQRGALRAVARRLARPAHGEGADRAEGVVLPARPDPHQAAPCGARPTTRTTRPAAPT